MAAIIYKCPNCGGDLRLHPETQKYRCEYCLSEFDPAKIEAEQEQPETGGVSASVPGWAATDGGAVAGAAGRTADSAVLYHCPSCGAEIVTDDTTAATFCYYCHNPVVLSGKLQGGFRPDYVIPFAVDKKKALEIFDQWIEKKRYIPKAFYSRDQIETMTGVYFPYWLYSCEAEGELDAEGHKNRTWTTGNIQYIQTEVYDVKREGTMPVEHVTRNALAKSNRRLIEGVLPFEMEKLLPFRMGYLSGFMAEKRDIEERTLEGEVRQEVQSFAENLLRSDTGLYDSLQVRSQRVNLKDETWKYALLPVWTLTYKDPKSGKIYYFACNGQTGKVCGELPVDPGRLMGLFASIFVPVFLALLLVGYFI